MASAYIIPDLVVDWLRTPNSLLIPHHYGSESRSYHKSFSACRRSNGSPVCPPISLSPLEMSETILKNHEPPSQRLGLVDSKKLKGRFTIF